jgi:hypothetical protein
VSWISKWAGWDKHPDELKVANAIVRNLAAKELESYEDDFLAFAAKMGATVAFAEAAFDALGKAVATGQFPAL